MKLSEDLSLALGKAVLRRALGPPELIDEATHHRAWCGSSLGGRHHHRQLLGVTEIVGCGLLQGERSNARRVALRLRLLKTHGVLGLALALER